MLHRLQLPALEQAALCAARASLQTKASAEGSDQSGAGPAQIKLGQDDLGDNGSSLLQRQTFARLYLARQTWLATEGAERWAELWHSLTAGLELQA